MLITRVMLVAEALLCLCCPAGNPYAEGPKCEYESHGAVAAQCELKSRADIPPTCPTISPLVGRRAPAGTG